MAEGVTGDADVASTLKHFIFLHEVFLQNIYAGHDISRWKESLSSEDAELLVVESQLKLFNKLHTP